MQQNVDGMSTSTNIDEGSSSSEEGGTFIRYPGFDESKLQNVSKDHYPSEIELPSKGVPEIGSILKKALKLEYKYSPSKFKVPYILDDWFKLSTSKTCRMRLDVMLNEAEREIYLEWLKIRVIGELYLPKRHEMSSFEPFIAPFIVICGRYAKLTLILAIENKNRDDKGCNFREYLDQLAKLIHLGLSVILAPTRLGRKMHLKTLRKFLSKQLSDLATYKEEHPKYKDICNGLMLALDDATTIRPKDCQSYLIEALKMIQPNASCFRDMTMNVALIILYDYALAFGFDNYGRRDENEIELNGQYAMLPLILYILSTYKKVQRVY